MALETCNANLRAGLTKCDKCDDLRTHSTQAGYETAPGVIEWREEINGCKKHKAIAVVHKLDGTTEVWSE
jgi:hypothetical protein